MAGSDNVGLTVVIPTLGAIISTLMFLSPLRAAWRARSNGALEKLNVIPFVFIVFNCSSWVAYAYVVNDWFVYATNAIGFLIGVTLFVNTALIGVPNQRHRDFIYLIVIVFAVWLLLMGTLERLVFETNSWQEGKDMGKKLWGWTSNIINFLYYASPLTTIFAVIKNRDRSSLVPALCVMNTVNGTFWFIYGLAIVDWFIIVPNGAGVVLGAFMTTLCLMFPNRHTGAPAGVGVLAPCLGMCFPRFRAKGKGAGDSDSGPADAASDSAYELRQSMAGDPTSAATSRGGELPNLESSKSAGMLGTGKGGGMLKALEEETHTNPAAAAPQPGSDTAAARHEDGKVSTNV